MSFYWITRLDAIVGASATIAIVLLIMALIIACFGVFDDWSKEIKKATLVSTIVGVFFLLVAIFTPTTEQACAIYFVDYLQKNEDARELPDKVIKSANLYFDKLIEELDKEQKEGKR